MMPPLHWAESSPEASPQLFYKIHEVMKNKVGAAMKIDDH